MGYNNVCSVKLDGRTISGIINDITSLILHKIRCKFSNQSSKRYKVYNLAYFHILDFTLFFMSP